MCISLDLNGSKIHAIYLVEFLKIRWHDAWWHDAMQKLIEQAKETHSDHKNMEVFWSVGLGALQHSTTTRESRPEI